MIKVKQIITGVMAAATIATTVLSLNVNAAGNYTDTGYSFKVSTSSKYTDFREKLDDTSASIKVTSGDYVIARVYGKTGILGGKADCTYGIPKTVGVSSTYTFLPNTVYEDGYSYACLGLTSASGTSFTSAGVWSPDSV